MYSIPSVLRQVKKRPGVLKDSDMDRRKSCAAFNTRRWRMSIVRISNTLQYGRTPLPGRESWKYLETLTLSLASKDIMCVREQRAMSRKVGGSCVVKCCETGKCTTTCHRSWCVVRQWRGRDTSAAR
eukprot:4387403-Amphidinium_carterae.1